ncbi:putative disease resistance RPP13-like protein 1 [Morella rubra]|uniref:Putative disease resistance RPP13-like protein 1 n=1 Tax=Morella rubra TaxID=262757 RepID=A0A6A1UVJ3_9ROSI|nr:putative disease resistance RPP13-like protein 1 [Morella rubra]
MAEAMVGGAFLSAFLQVLFDRMASREVVDFVRGRKLAAGLLKKLEIALLSVDAVLEDAEEKQATTRAAKKWLDELKDVVYDAEDILDEIATESLRCKLDADVQKTASEVQTSISTSINHFVEELEPRILEVLDKIEFLAKKKDVIGLREGVEGKPAEKLPTTSLVEESCSFGRDDEREKIINSLLLDDASGNELSVIAIVGMGGIGKSTLAKLIYNDDRVKKHFNLDAWVYVSEEFDLFKVTKTILETVTLSTSDVKDLNRLQVTLKEKLREKKFLLVLDDVWNETHDYWEALRNTIKSSMPGSKVIVTTRNERVALVMCAFLTHHIKLLSDEDCWSIFAKHAFPDSSYDVDQELETIGREIVGKCKGLPLAAKTFGTLLWSKLGADDWEKILKSELWTLPHDGRNILLSLRLSYKHLPSHLKRCFAYCSIFPKDYVFEKDQLVLLWMAEGFLQQSCNRTMEEVGDDFFFDLVSRSFFQQSSGNKSQFVMHDLVNDLAVFVSGQLGFRLEGDYSHDIVSSKTRHLSYVRTRFDNLKKFEVLYKAKQLRTFIPLGLSWSDFHLARSVPHDLLVVLTCLRVLSLSHYSNITDLPDSIDKMKQLRYLDLSSTAVKRLPESICELCNLQTLKLSGCQHLAVLPGEMRKLVSLRYMDLSFTVFQRLPESLCELDNLQTLKLSGCQYITELPRDMWKLSNLRHLDITNTGIKEMPMQLSRLKCLRTLTTFINGRQSGSCIGELRKLTNLRKGLSILELQNIECPGIDTGLKDRKYIEELVLEWNAFADILESQKAVLNSLRPHTNLKSLTISYYGGENFPDWVGHQSFCNITSLHLNRCHRCSLPPLGQLPCLQDLSIIGFDGVVTVGAEFCGGHSASIKPFGALEVLTFERLWNWEEYSFGVENEYGAFPRLRELYIRCCPKLTRGSPIHLPSLAKLEIIECPQLVASFLRAPAVSEVHLINCNEAVLKELAIGTQKLKVAEFNFLESLPDTNSSLQHLEIRDCFSLLSFPRGDLLSMLKSLEITSSRKFDLPVHVDNYLALERLLLKDSCDSLRSFPLEFFPKLSQIVLWGCRNLESLTVPEQHENDLVTLNIRIEDCPKFVSFPEGGLRAPNLTWFSILKCGSLKSLPDKMHSLLPTLGVLRIEDCPNIDSFPGGGLPSSLNFISILRCDKLVGSWMDWGLQKLPYVRTLYIDGMPEDMESFPKAEFLPTNLTILDISSFPNVKCLDKKGLQDLFSLEELRIHRCPKLEYIPDEGLPASLSFLWINRCPLLKKRCKIAPVDCIKIDDELIE